MKTERDPITQVKDMLQAAGVPEDDIKEIDKEIKAIVNDSAEFAQSSPEPQAFELWTDVLAENV
jgi:pyruvate dehydrogenase E1 component alpha subunit